MIIQLAVVLLLPLLIAVVARRFRDDERRAFAAWLLGNRWQVALVASGGVMALLGIGMVIHSTLAATQVVELASMEAGAAVDAEFVSVEGYERPEFSYCEEGGETCYTALTSTQSGTVVAVLVASQARATERASWSGFVSRSSSSRDRRRLEAAGAVPAADLFTVLPESREARADAGRWISLAGVLLLSAGWVWLRRKRSVAAVPVA